MLIKKYFIFLFTFFCSLPLSAMTPPIEELAIEKIKLHKRQEEVNNIVCDTIIPLYKKINKNWSYQKPGVKKRIDSLFWEIITIQNPVLVSGEKKFVQCSTLRLKTSPNNIIEALDDLINKPAVIECSIAINTGMIFCVKELLGESTFVPYVAHFYKMLEETKGWSVDQFFFQLPRQFITQLAGKAIPGSSAYITNIPEYATFKPGNYGQGSNLFCTRDNEYIGFGEIYKKGPQPLAQEVEDLFKLFCDPSDVQCEHKKHEDICNSFKEDKELFYVRRQKTQEKNSNSYLIFDVKKINHCVSKKEVIL